jgi:pyruvate dehydrogenase E1 component alpha subunit
MGIDLEDLPAATLREWLEAMLMIREFEIACEPLSLDGKMVGAIHSSVGQEAVAVGSMGALQGSDIVAGSHRSHHHALARGLPPTAVMAELFGRVTGISEGRGGTMHLRDVGRGYLGGNGIVGAGVGLALGAALAASMQQRDQVAVGFVGDGGMNTGRTWEFINLAVVWKLPLIVVCENNLYAVETTTARMTGGGSIPARAEAFGIAVSQVDGQDVVAMYGATKAARDRAIGGLGPTFIEAKTYRFQGHNTGQVVRYRTEAEVELWRSTKDPIQRLRLSLETAGLLDSGDFDRISTRARSQIEEAITFAESSDWPDPRDAGLDVTSLDLHVRGNP